ncbi:unnamed protein product [Diabrotica balteata]|uniref:Peptidase S1 domain-containing protein n=1 Tax=Diabrotica balteata TaxID=107213 RepID=A0A9N9XBV9_DIABA|nr:unnamed protein product [Diabrotica balteata]
MKHKYGLAVLLIWMPMMLSARVPPNPCPKYFSYYKDPQGRIYGAVVLPYDRSTSLVFSVNASFVGNFNRQAKLRLQKLTKLNELNDGTATVTYNIFFPFTDVIPKITGLTYNGKVFCRGPAESVEGAGSITNVWSQDSYMFSRQKYGFYEPETLPDTSEDDIPIKSPDETPRIRQPLPTPTPPKVKPITPMIPQRQPESWETSTQDINTSYNPDTKEINELFFNPSKCGVAGGSEVRLYGATDTKLGQYPWLVALFWQSGFNFDYKCSATLISNKHVLTAARCFQYNDGQVENIAEIFLVMGTDNLDKWNSNGAVTRKARRVDVHPDYKKNKESANGDIAIILLDLIVQFTDVLSPVCLWKGQSDLHTLTNKMGIIAGFGQDENSLQEGLTHVFRAKRAVMPIVDQIECLTSPLGLQQLVSDKTFCTKSSEKQPTGPCTGDTGAGFFISMDGAYYLRGVASVIPYNKEGKCDFSTRYVAFCDAAKFSDWIKSHMK